MNERNERKKKDKKVLVIYDSWGKMADSAGGTVGPALYPSGFGSDDYIGISPASAASDPDGIMVKNPFRYREYYLKVYVFNSWHLMARNFSECRVRNRKRSLQNRGVKSSILRYFLTVGSEILSAFDIADMQSPLLCIVLIFRAFDMSIISFLPSLTAILIPVKDT